MADLNKIFLIGRLTHDPELRYTPGQTAVTDLRLATSRQYQGRDGSMQKETLYIDVEVWARQAETCCQYLKTGRQVHVEGYLKLESWEDKQTGQKRSKIKAVADRVQFLDSRRDEAGAPADDQQDYGGAPTPPPRSTGGRGGPGNGSFSSGRGPSGGHDAPSGPARKGPMPSPAPDEEEADDIPF
jgi:single-strand DNA-binding protein